MLTDLDTRCVLLVEDEYFIANELRLGFEKAGFKVLGPTGRVEEALSLIEGAGRIDGAVLDVNLHNAMVYPVADALYARGVPFMFTTGYDRSALPERYSNARCFDKPIAPSKIIAALFN